jgi:hypothetical protein
MLQTYLFLVEWVFAKTVNIIAQTWDEDNDPLDSLIITLNLYQLAF